MTTPRTSEIAHETTIANDRGASAVEFAIVASLLFLILFGTLQFGLAYNRSQALQASAREGARLGSLNETTVAQIRQRVRDSVDVIDRDAIAEACPEALEAGNGCVAVTPAGSGSFRPCLDRSGQTVRVEVRYRMQIAIPFWPTEGIDLSGAGDFVCE